ncbi:MAG: hypothetical protein ACFFDW_12580 [Candidatus Thorarchaeota archaeon]
MYQNGTSSSVENNQSPPKRLVTLDVLRGVAIFGMTIVHISYKLYNAEWLYEGVSTGLSGLPFYVLILMFVLGYFGTWHGFFLFISSIVNSYVYTRKSREGLNSKKLLIKNLIAGAIVVVLGYLVEGFGYFGYFGHAIRSGEWNTFNAFLGENSWIQTLQIIGLCIILNGIIQYFLMRNSGYEKVKQNLLIYFALIVFVLVFTPILNNLIANASFWDSTSSRTWPDIYFVSGNRSVGVWFLTILAGPKDPLFPYMTSAFVGAMIGIFLANPKPSKKGLTWFALGGVGMIIIGGLLVAFSFLFNFPLDPRIPFIDTGLPFSIIEEPPTISTYLVRLGGQVCLVMIMFACIEFRGRGERFANRLVVRYFRRWSSLSLTLYSLQILELLPRWLLKISFYNTGVTDINFMNEYVMGRGTEVYLVLVIIFVLLFYEFVIFILYKVKMVGSLEWFFVKAQNLFSKVKSTKIEPAVCGRSINWVSYIEEPMQIPEEIIKIGP